MLPWDLEDWLTHEGDRVVHKLVEQGPPTLTSTEQLLHDIWLLDTEVRNGGLSQYFGNHGIAEWRYLIDGASMNKMSAFDSFAERIEAVVSGFEDPCEAILQSSIDVDDVYYQFEVEIVRELRAIVESTE